MDFPFVVLEIDFGDSECFYEKFQLNPLHFQIYRKRGKLIKLLTFMYWCAKIMV